MEPGTARLPSPQAAETVNAITETLKATHGLFILGTMRSSQTNVNGPWGRVDLQSK